MRPAKRKRKQGGNGDDDDGDDDDDSDDDGGGLGGAGGVNEEGDDSDDGYDDDNGDDGADAGDVVMARSAGDEDEDNEQRQVARPCPELYEDEDAGFCRRMAKASAVDATELLSSEPPAQAGLKRPPNKNLHASSRAAVGTGLSVVGSSVDEAGDGAAATRSGAATVYPRVPQALSSSAGAHSRELVIPSSGRSMQTRASTAQPSAPPASVRFSAGLQSPVGAVLPTVGQQLLPPGTAGSASLPTPGHAAAGHLLSLGAGLEAIPLTPLQHQWYQLQQQFLQFKQLGTSDSFVFVPQLQQQQHAGVVSSPASAPPPLPPSQQQQHAGVVSSPASAPPPQQQQQLGARDLSPKCGLHTTQSAHTADLSAWLSEVETAFNLNPSHPQLLEQYQEARARHDSGDCAGLRKNVENAPRMSADFTTASSLARKLALAPYATPVSALVERQFPALSGSATFAGAAASTGSSAAASLDLDAAASTDAGAAAHILSTRDIEDISAASFFDRNSVEFRGLVLSGLSKLHSSLSLQNPFSTYRSTALPCIEKQWGTSCFMHVTHSLLGRQIAGRSSAALFTLIARSVKVEFVERADSAPFSASNSAITTSIRPMDGSAASALAPSACAAGATTRSAASGASSSSSSASNEAYIYLPRLLKPRYGPLFQELDTLRPCETHGFDASDLSMLFSLFNRQDKPAVFFGCVDLDSIELRSALSKDDRKKRTFPRVVDLLSRFTDRLTRYGPPSTVTVDSANDDDEMQEVGTRGSNDCYVTRDKERMSEPVVPINQIVFCYGIQQKLRSSMGHFCSVQRVDLNDKLIPFPHGTKQEHKSCFWWLQDSRRGLDLVHEDVMPDYFFKRGQQVSVIPLRLPLSIKDRMATVADIFDSAVNSVLAVAGLASFGPFPRV